MEQQKSSRDSLQYSSGYSSQTNTPSCSEDTIPSQGSAPLSPQVRTQALGTLEFVWIIAMDQAPKSPRRQSIYFNKANYLAHTEEVFDFCINGPIEPAQYCHLPL